MARLCCGRGGAVRRGGVWHELYVYTVLLNITIAPSDSYSAAAQRLTVHLLLGALCVGASLEADEAVLAVVGFDEGLLVDQWAVYSEGGTEDVEVTVPSRSPTCDTAAGAEQAEG